MIPPVCPVCPTCRCSRFSAGIQKRGPHTYIVIECRNCGWFIARRPREIVRYALKSGR